MLWVCMDRVHGDEEAINRLYLPDISRSRLVGKKEHIICDALAI